MRCRRSRLRKRKQVQGFLLTVICLSAAAAPAGSVSRYDHRSKPSSETEEKIIISHEQLAQFIDYATSYMVRVSHTRDQDKLFAGRFTYQTSLRKQLQVDGFDESPQRSYNLLRHNGALYALSQSYLRLLDIEQQQQQSHRAYPDNRIADGDFVLSSQQVKEALVRGIDYLKRDAIFPVPDRTEGTSYYRRSKDIPNLLAVWERTDVTNPKSQLSQAKLGGAGLALVALTQMELIEPDTTPIDYLRKIANFIEYMQKDSTDNSKGLTVAGNKRKIRKAYDDINHRFEKRNQQGERVKDNSADNIDQDGSFVCKYRWKDGPDDSWTSLYYPGEASLGLVMLAEMEVDPSYKQRWIDVATRALMYLERLRRHQPLHEIEPDHWALLATSRILQLLEKNSDEYSMLYRHGVRVAESMVAAHTEDGLKLHEGCFTYDRRTCPTATRLEGLCKFFYGTSYISTY